MKSRAARFWICCLFTPSCLTTAIVACQDYPRRRQSVSEDRQRQAKARDDFERSLERYAQSCAVRGTIGEVTWIRGMRRMSVRGYGLVVGLGQNGSRTCPQRIRRKLAAEIRKQYRLGDSRIGLEHITPEKIIDSSDTAVVLVRGEIGAAALAGAPFDLTVQALEGTETVSLEGGQLYSCDLRYFHPTAPGTVQEGAILATAKGPCFVNPFAQDPDSATPSNLRIARVLGGGRSLKSREVHLMLNSPSYALARRIQDRINSRYGIGQTIAQAITPNMISLEIPRRYARRELEFLALIRHTYVSLEGLSLDHRAQELAQELLDAKAPHDSIGLAWEAIGKTVRPVIQSLYTHDRDYVSFYAARTGLRLRDRLALQVLTEHARDSDSLFQNEAIRELGAAVDVLGADLPLVEIARSGLDPRCRMLAFRGLVRQINPIVRSEILNDAFVLDQIEKTDGPPLIYARITEEPRIAILGTPACRTPLFYRHPRGLVTMNADPGAETISMIRVTPTGRTSPTAHASRDVFELTRLLGGKADQDEYGQVTGLGLCYSQVVEILARMCQERDINAEFKLEEREESMIPSPDRLTGRPESDL